MDSYPSFFRKYFLLFSFVSILSLSLSAATGVSNKTVVLISLGDISFPLVVEKAKPDTVPPSKAKLTIAPPSSTYEDKEFIEITGESDSRIYVNGQYAGMVGGDNKALITLDTSGDIGKRTYTIVLVDYSGNRSDPLTINIEKIEDPKFNIDYKGMTLYHHNMDSSQYRLAQLSDSEFNGLTAEQKRLVANKLLSTLFFGYPLKTLEEKIDSGQFISNIREGIQEEITDRGWIEDYILDDQYFEQFSQYSDPQAITILSRFYAMKELDSYFLNNWIAYILTQTIMFSPANELDTTHTANISSVYNRIVNFLDDDGGMRYITYVHMMSEDNWRRFRSPEDNGREMLEIFLFDEDDTHVPIAAQALQNWSLNRDGDTLEVGLNENTEPLHLFGTLIVNGDDFYRELVKSDTFTKGVTKRLVDFFFTQSSDAKRAQITDTIVSSHPETWQDILLQIVFSKEYLLYTTRAKSMEETFYSLTRQVHFRHRGNTFYYMKYALEDMHQASMQYKLGRIERVPLDSLSFAYYHKYIREQIFVRRSNPDYEDAYHSWSRQGWGKELVTFDKFDYDENNIESSLENLINHIFKSTISREATSEELKLFRSHMIYEEDGEKHFHWAFDMFTTYNNDPERQEEQRESHKRYIANIIMDYISRLEETYMHKKVK